MHIVSYVTCFLKPCRSSIDLLKSTLRAGTLSGATNITAMEIILDLVRVKRGL